LVKIISIINKKGGGKMIIPIKTILSIIAAVIQMIAEGMSESAAISIAASKFGVSESLIRKYL
jgi:hypothetical protein